MQEYVSQDFIYIVHKNRQNLLMLFKIRINSGAMANACDSNTLERQEDQNFEPDLENLETQ